ncbi:MAG: aminotransferase class V-fold PLP-dependent enzyme [Bacteroidota bacterium]
MLTCQKSLFSLEEGIHYVNCATMSPNLKSVEQAGIEGILRKSNPYKITQETFFETTTPVKKLFAQLINCPDPERIALIPSVSYGMAIVARNLGFKPNLRAGQEIVMVHEEFPSDVYAWEGVCMDKGLKIKNVLPPNSFDDRGKVWNETLINSINANTCMVVISPTHWANGTRFDLEAIGKQCRLYGALFVLDGTQSIGALPFDVQLVRPDAVINGGYKWLLGPYSSGVAYFGEYFDTGSPIERNWINRVGSEEFRNLINYEDHYRPKADRYNVGERSNFILNPMLAASLQQLLDWGVDNIQNYCKNLLEEPLKILQSKGFWIDSEAYRTNHLVGLRVPVGTEISRIQAELKRRNVVVSIRGEAIRISPNVYNDQQDIDLLVEGLLAGI